jgi:hypothetical protein
MHLVGVQPMGRTVSQHTQQFVVIFYRHHTDGVAVVTHQYCVPTLYVVHTMDEFVGTCETVVFSKM